MSTTSPLLEVSMLAGDMLAEAGMKCAQTGPWRADAAALKDLRCLLQRRHLAGGLLSL